MLWPMFARWSIACATVLAGSACAPSPTEAAFDSPNPASRLYAIEEAGKQRDKAAVAELVEQLESDDPAVRMLAIEALERIEGDTRGYCHEDPPYARREAVDEWVEVVRQRRPSPATTESTASDDDG
jgi:hypothetical protein